MRLAPLTLALAAAGAITPAWAAEVAGQITDLTGAPVAGVTIEVTGAQLRTQSDAQGRYRLAVADNQHLHLHVGAPAYVHQELDLDITTGLLVQDLVLRPSNIENITVTGTALGRSVLESATPVSVLSDDKLRLATAPTLGDTLAKEPGVQSSYFGPVASRPVIRGMDGARVKVLQNGLSVSDASTISADHSVTAEASTAQQIEILRGPGTLLYGNGAIGGVVNVVDNRIAQHPIEGLSGEVDGRYGTGADERTLAASLNGGNGRLALHLDGTRRRTHDVDIPGYGEKDPDEPQPHGTLANSDVRQDEGTAGIAYTGDRGFIGVSVNRLESNYGIVGHEHEHEEEAEAEHEEHGDEGVRIDLEKTNYQLLAGLGNPLPGFNRLSFAAAYTDYQHRELEEGLAATTFTNKESEGRLSLYHDPLGEWQGVIGLHLNHRDFAASGEEAITPSSKTDSLAAFVVEERQFGNLNLELGARVERYQIKAGTLVLEGHDGDQVFTPAKQRDTNLSLSAGSVWEFSPGYNLGLALTHAERSATAEELYSYGPHLATGTFEVGALYHLHGDHGHPSDGSLEQEKANNLDLTLRKFEGDWSWSLNLFYNEVDNYFYQRNTGVVVGEDEEEEAHEEEGEHHHHGEGLPIYQYSQGNARLYGFEAQVKVPMGELWSIDAFSDYTRGKLKDGGNLPRISPLRLGLTVNLDWQDWHADLGAVRYGKQDKVAEFESASDGYTLVDASLSYRYYSGNGDLFFYLKGNNLTDREARPHTSFLKDKAPLPGRNLTLGVRYAF